MTTTELQKALAAAESLYDAAVREGRAAQDALDAALQRRLEAGQRVGHIRAQITEALK